MGLTRKNTSRNFGNYSRKSKQILPTYLVLFVQAVIYAPKMQFYPTGYRMFGTKHSMFKKQLFTVNVCKNQTEQIFESCHRSIRKRQF